MVEAEDDIRLAKDQGDLPVDYFINRGQYHGRKKKFHCFLTHRMKKKLPGLKLLVSLILSEEVQELFYVPKMFSMFATEIWLQVSQLQGEGGVAW